MHEFSLIKDLLNRIHLLVAEQRPNRAQSVTVELGALSHISADHFREHFEQAVAGTDLEHLELQVECNTDMQSPTAQDIILKSMDFSTASDAE
ncbi:MAG: hydrogenase maturation nickel metallochaperone HypA [Gammaproteobacteria bacterium]|nr:hydrogenase maturation nickel metallochaperone HypA [Gammaproteobacteria bacterium]